MTSFKESSLRGADLRSASMNGTNFKNADLTDANVRTVYHFDALTGAFISEATTDLSNVRGLTQTQLNQMHGDSRTGIPVDLTRPTNWEVLPDVHEDPSAIKGFIDKHFSKSSALETNALLILKTLPTSVITAREIAMRLESTVATYHQEMRWNQSEEGDLLFRISEILKLLADEMENLKGSRDDKDNLIQILQARLKEKRRTIEDLKEIMKTKPSFVQTVMGSALGAAGGTAITAGFGYLFGPEGSVLVNSIWDLMTQFGTVSPHVPHSHNLNLTHTSCAWIVHWLCMDCATRIFALLRPHVGQSPRASRRNRPPSDLCDHFAPRRR